MIKEASSLAPCVHGNEWFKFASVDQALEFAFSHMKQVAQMNEARISIKPVVEKRQAENKETLRHSFYPVLDHAIAVEGGKSRLAKAMNVAPSTISSWLARGLPMHVANELVRKYSRRKVPKSPLDWKPKNHTTTKENP